MGETCTPPLTDSSLRAWWKRRTAQMFQAQAKIVLYPTENGAWRLRAQAYRESWESGEIWNDEDLDVRLREARLWVNRMVSGL